MQNNTAKLQQIKAQLDNISPGPWHLNAMGEIVKYKQTGFDDALTDKNDMHYQAPIYGLASGGLMAYYTPADARFLVSSRTDVPWLVAELQRMTESRDAWRKVADTAIDKLAQYKKALSV